MAPRRSLCILMLRSTVRRFSVCAREGATSHAWCGVLPPMMPRWGAWSSWCRTIAHSRYDNEHEVVFASLPRFPRLAGFAPLAGLTRSPSVIPLVLATLFPRSEGSRCSTQSCCDFLQLHVQIQTHSNTPRPQDRESQNVSIVCSSRCERVVRRITTKTSLVAVVLGGSLSCGHRSAD